MNVLVQVRVPCHGVGVVIREGGRGGRGGRGTPQAGHEYVLILNEKQTLLECAVIPP